MKEKIPYNKPYFIPQGFVYMQEAFLKGKISGDGYYSKLVSKFMEDKFGTKKALFVTSCSAALDMAAILLDLAPEDEVILPSFTFVSTANAIKLRRAQIVFAEIDPITMNIDPLDVEKKITPNTKAIFVVHYAGVSCDMDAIMDLAKKHNLKVVEDAAQGVNAKYKGQYLGSIGHIGCYSFHETKNYICGEGGALLINDDSLMERAEIIWEKGTNRRKFFRGEIDKYSWVDIGSSYLGSDLLAAFLYAQFEELDSISKKRKEIYDTYFSMLKPLELKDKLILPHIPRECESNYHIFHLILPTGEIRNALMKYLKENKILAIFHYIPLHSSPMGLKMGNHPEDLPLTEEYASRILRLPLYYELTIEQVEYIVGTIIKFFETS